MDVLPDSRLPFFELTPSLVAGEPLPPGWVPLHALPLLIFVGVTGVGKSTTIELLQARIGPCTLLPDRRDLTDRLIISAMQAQDGLPPAPIRDRAQRFEYTRRFREQFPGGMAYALTLLALKAESAAGLLTFDGLRGANEIEFAAGHLPNARFVMLDARDSTRVARLLGRNDAFDTIIRTSVPATSGEHSFAALAGPEAATIFAPVEQESLLALVESGRVSAAELAAKVAIVVEERRSYDPATTRAALEALPDRALIVDTERATPPQVARLIAAQLAAWQLIGPHNKAQP